MKRHVTLRMALVALVCTACHPPLHQRALRDAPSPWSADAYARDDDTTALIDAYLEGAEARRTATVGTLVCASTVLHDVMRGPDERVVFAAASCADVVVRNGDLFMETGSAGEPLLFRIVRKDGPWRVAEHDAREFAADDPSPFVRRELALLPDGVRARFSPTLSAARHVEKAARVVHVEVRHPVVGLCVDGACGAGEICVADVVARCMRTCADQPACGVGFTCRAQCPDGRVACPEGQPLANVCVPDIPSAGLTKDGAPW